MSNKGTIYIISGPSGAGKSTVLGRVLQNHDRAFFSISATTRTPRAGELDGVNYHFVTRDEFERMLANNELLEHTEYVGNYYGTPIKPIYERSEQGYDVFLDVEVDGKQQVSEKIPEAVSIFISPPNIETLEKRLRDRKTDSEEKIISRLNTAREEMKLANTYDHIIINDELDSAVAALSKIILK